MRQRASDGWPRHRQRQRLRLLVENEGEALRDVDFRCFEEAGFEVALCSGPGDGSECTLVERHECSLAEDADVVLFGLGLDSDRHRDVVRAFRSHLPATPVVVELPRYAAHDASLPDGCTALAFPTSVAGQVRVLRHAAEHARAPRSRGA